MFDVLRIQSLPCLLLVNRLGEPMFLPWSRLPSYLSYSTNMKNIYTVSERSEESNKEGINLETTMIRWTRVEKDSCIPASVYSHALFHCTTELLPFHFFLLDALQSMERGNTTERCKLTRNSMLTLWILICMFQVIDSYIYIYIWSFWI